MTGIPFCKLVPGGNTTILLTRPDFAPEELSGIAETLMHPMHLQAEQVGALYTVNPVPHLQMMGGEFCVNATRSAALLLDRMGRLVPSAPGCRCGKITVSGISSPVRVLTADTEDALRAALSLQEGAEAGDADRAPASTSTRLFCAARITCGSGSTRVIDLEEGIALVHLPGISHLLVDALLHPMPADWRKAAAMWRRKAGLETAPASGVVWYLREGEETSRIRPAVAVRGTHSEHMETACGSASLALALMLHTARRNVRPSEEPFPSPVKGEKRPSFSITQPSGESLGVLLGVLDAEAEPVLLPSHAWVFGAVRLIGEGTAYM